MGTSVRDAGVALGVSVVVCTALAFYVGIAVQQGAAVIAGVGLVAGAAIAVGSRRDRWSGPADRVTLARTVLVGGCATLAVLALVGAIGPRPWWLVALAVPALLLDGVDGWVARRTDTATDAGARLDMEVDAALLLVLSSVVVLTQGFWVLAIGGLRYLWVVAGWFAPVLRGPVVFRFSRKVIAVVQAVALILALTPVVPSSTARGGLLVAVILLVFSFSRDGLQLVRDAVDRHGPALADAEREPVVDLRLVEVVRQSQGGGHPGSPGRGRELQ